MTNETNYYDQLQASSTSSRLAVPAAITQAVVDRLTNIQGRSELILPESITYVKSISGNTYYSTTHLGRVRNSGWQLEIVQAVKNFGSNPTLVILIKKVGPGYKGSFTSEHRNGNNPIRNKSRRR